MIGKIPFELGKPFNLALGMGPYFGPMRALEKGLKVDIQTKRGRSLLVQQDCVKGWVVCGIAVLPLLNFQIKYNFSLNKV